MLKNETFLFVQPEIQVGENMNLEAQIISFSSFFPVQQEFGLEDPIWNHLDLIASCII